MAIKLNKELMNYVKSLHLLPFLHTVAIIIHKGTVW